MATRKKAAETAEEIKEATLEEVKAPAELDPIAAATAAITALGTAGGSGELSAYTAGKAVDTGKKVFLQSDLDNLQAQIDALSTQVDTLSGQLTSFTQGRAMAANDDLDNYKTPGHYFADTSAKAQTILHRPTGVTNPFGVDVKFNTASNRLVQTLIVNYADLSFYQRKLLAGGESGTWTKWAKVTGTETDPVEPVTP